MAFSGALTLTDLNDFITPSQACIKPVEQTNKQNAPDAAKTDIHIDSAGAYYEVSEQSNGRKLEQAQINLNDCLACSGCITSAESVLITLQSHIEVLNFLESNEQSSPDYKVPIVSVAPQSLASLAASLSSSSSTTQSTSPRQILRRLRSFFVESLGFGEVFDTNFARHIALREHVREFEERKTSAENGRLPMLASACPGWICYAEKTHSEMLPFIAETKSPQQIMGSLVKHWIGEQIGKKPNEIYHVTVMPCYDKKLEASRSDFFNDIYSTRDVDCVITTGELDVLLHEKGWDLSIPVADETKVESSSMFNSSVTPIPELPTHYGSSSGSYLQAIIGSVMERYSNDSDVELTVKAMRNADHIEYTIKRRTQSTGIGTEAISEEILFKAAKCYGFRNLQNLVRKVGKERGLRVATGAAGRLAGGNAGRGKGIIRRGRASEEPDRPYDYVEVMACPGGCVNGGGQLKPPSQRRNFSETDEEGYSRQWEDSGVKVNGAKWEDLDSSSRWGDRDWTRRVEETYWHEVPAANGRHRSLGKSHLDDTEADVLLDKVMSDLCSIEERRRNFFRTQYRAVESDVVGISVQW